MTGRHPVWSVDRETWVPVCDLEPGETLETLHGTTQFVSATRRPDATPVFNLEVDADHVYRVGDDGLLVHNDSGAPSPCGFPCPPEGGDKARTLLTNSMTSSSPCSGIPSDVPKQAHHIVPVSTFKLGDLGDRLCRLGIDLNSAENGVWLPTCQYKKNLKDQPTVHFGRPLGDYEKDIRERFIGVTTREEALKVINQIRDELCSGKLALQRTINPCPGYNI